MGVSPVIHLSPSRSHLHPRLQRAGTGALMQRHHVREMETFHIVNPQVVRESLMRKETGKEHPGLLEEGVLQTLRDRNSLLLCEHAFFTVLLHPWEAGSSPRVPRGWKPWHSAVGSNA